MPCDNPSMFLSRAILLLLAAVCAANPPDAPATQPSAAGFWMGEMKVGGRALRLYVRLTDYVDEGPAGTFNSLDQGAIEQKLDEVRLDAQQVHLKLHSKAWFDGTLAADGQSIGGKWTLGAMSFPVTFHRLERPHAIKRPQEPTAPLPYDVRQVRFTGPPGVTFAGELSTPRDATGPVPAVFLVSGSGPSDRDEYTAGHKPFLIIADYLTRRGIAVLRCDDRGVGESTGDRSTATSSDYADDALFAVRFLQTQPEVDPKRVGLIGHSEGGLIAPLAATRSADVAFVIMLAGPATTGERVLLSQRKLFLESIGAPPEVAAAMMRLSARMIELGKSALPVEEARRAAADAVDAELAALPEDYRKELSGLSAAMQSQVQTLSKPWMRFFLTYDPAATLSQVKCPVLALVAEKDMHVPADENAPIIEAAFGQSGNARARVVRLPGLNHLFQECQTGDSDEFARIEQTMSESALKAMAQWIESLYR